MKIIKSSELKTTSWSGGKTTELFIYPENSEYKLLNFDFRISTATIEVEESTFTKLPGVQRILLLLEGKLELIHEEHHSKLIQLYDEDVFEGDWVTHSKGKAVDFNIMTTKPLKSLATVLNFKKTSQFSDRNFDDYCFMYLNKGAIECSAGKVSKGDLLVITEKGMHDFEVLEESQVVHFTISNKKGDQ